MLTTKFYIFIDSSEVCIVNFSTAVSVVSWITSSNADFYFLWLFIEIEIFRHNYCSD